MGFKYNPFTGTLDQVSVETDLWDRDHIAVVYADGSGTHATIAAAYADASVDVVYLMPGNHTITNTTPLAISRSFSVTGIGQETFINIDGTDTAQNLFNVSGAAEFNIENVSMGTCAYAVAHTGSTRVILRTCEADGFNRTVSLGLMFVNTANGDVVIQNCVSLFVGNTAIVVVNVDNFIVENSTFLFPVSGDAIAVAGGDDISITSNNFIGGNGQLVITGGTSVVSRSNTYNLPGASGAININATGGIFESQADVAIGGTSHIIVDTANTMDYQFTAGAFDNGKFTIGAGQRQPQNYVSVQGDLYADTFKGIRDDTVTGSNSLTYNDNSSFFVNLRQNATNSGGTRTVNVNAANTFPALLAGMCNVDHTGNTSSMILNGIQSLMLGAASVFANFGASVGNGVVMSCTNTAAAIIGTGSVGLNPHATNSQTVTMTSSGVGSFIAGNARVQAQSTITNVAMLASGDGAVNMGAIDGVGTTGGGAITSSVAGNGSMSCSYLVFGTETVSGDGSLSVASINANTASSALGVTVSGSGSLSVLSHAGSSGSAILSGDGSVLVGRMSGSGIITCTAAGSMVVASVTGTAATVSATNSQQFGPGTNNQANCMQLGVLGDGIRVRGLTSAFSTPTDGDIRQDTSSRVRLHTEGNDNTVFSDELLSTTSTSFTLTTQKYIRWNGASAGTCNLTALSSAQKRKHYIANVGTADLTIDPSGAETISGNTTVVLSPGESIIIVAHAAEWVNY